MSDIEFKDTNRDAADAGNEPADVSPVRLPRRRLLQGAAGAGGKVGAGVDGDGSSVSVEVVEADSSFSFAAGGEERNGSVTDAPTAGGVAFNRRGGARKAAEKGVTAVGGVEADPETETETKEEGGEKSGNKKALRLTLLILIVIVLALMVYINISQPDVAPVPKLSSMPQIAPVLADAEGDALARNIQQDLVRGEYKGVLGKADQLRQRTPQNMNVLLELFRAEAIAAVFEADEELRSLPTSVGGESTSLTLEARMARHIKRLKPLSVLAGLRIDWGEKLTGIPQIAEIYNRNYEEVDTAIARLEKWEEAQGALSEATEVMEAVPMNFEHGRSLLLVAGDMLEEENLRRLGNNIGNLQEAQKAIERSDIEEAYHQLKAIAWSEGEIDPDSTAYEHRIENSIRKAVAEREEQIKQWRLLYEAGRTAKTEYESGKHPGAVKTLETALLEIEPDNVAAEKLSEELKESLGHYRAVNRAWDQCVAARGRKHEFKEQLMTFGSLMLVANDEERDAWQFAKCREELDGIKAEMSEVIAEKGKTVAQMKRLYTKIDGKMRNPETPQESFAEQARRLTAMTAVAEEILELRNLTPNWEMSTEVNEVVAAAKEVIADYSEQTQRLFNMGKLYRNRGGMEQSRECFSRVVLLGNLESNVFYGEANVMLDDRAGGSSQEVANDAEE